MRRAKIERTFYGCGCPCRGRGGVWRANSDRPCTRKTRPPMWRETRRRGGRGKRGRGVAEENRHADTAPGMGTRILLFSIGLSLWVSGCKKWGDFSPLLHFRWYTLAPTLAPLNHASARVAPLRCPILLRVKQIISRSVYTVPR
jgi:hypothetical protein